MSIVSKERQFWPDSIMHWRSWAVIPSNLKRQDLVLRARVRWASEADGELAKFAVRSRRQLRCA